MIIIVDTIAPQVDVFALCRKLREADARTPIFLLCDVSDACIEAQAALASADGVFLRSSGARAMIKSLHQELGDRFLMFSDPCTMAFAFALNIDCDFLSVVRRGDVSAVAVVVGVDRNVVHTRHLATLPFTTRLA